MLRRRWVRTLLTSAGLVAGALALVLVGASYSYTGSGTRPYCARCHEIRPMVDAWQHSTHRALGCGECHGSAVTANLQFHLKNAGRVLNHWRGSVPEAIRLQRRDVMALQQRCRACHAREFADWESGPHGATYAEIFLDAGHNERVPLMDDCLRCHGMHFEEGIGELVTPVNRVGPWELRTAVASEPVMPCLTCHAIHREGAPERGRRVQPAPGATQARHTASLGLFDRRSSTLVPVDALTVPAMRKAGVPVRTSPDPRQALCYQCHAAHVTAEVFSGDDRTPTGVHEGLSCLSCHQKHGQRTRASCAGCHPQLSNCGLDVEKMDTTFASLESRHDVHAVACVDCHTKGVPPRRVQPGRAAPAAHAPALPGAPDRFTTSR